jgi:uncharacterized protein
LLFYERIKIRSLFIVNILLSIAVFIGIGIYEHSFYIRVDKNLVMLFTYSGLLLWFIWKAKKTGNSPSDFTRNFSAGLRWKEIVLVLLFHFLITIGFIFLVVLLVSYLNPELINTVLYDEDMIAPQGLNSKIYYAITAVILAPVVEEIAFRGIILNRFRVKWGIGRAVILSSILFGVLHYKLAIVGALTLGICLALIYIRTENILISITIHFINNLIASAFLFLPAEDLGTVETFTLGQARIAGWLLGVPLFIVSAIFLITYFRKNWPKATSKRKALLIVDMQEAFFNFSGRELHKAVELINNTSKLIEWARETKLPIIYMQHAGTSGGKLQFGTEGWHIHHSIAPLRTDTVIHKKTVDPFTHTSLKKVLAFMNIGQLIIAGLQTEYSIDTACRYAAGLGYKVILASDAHSTFDSSHMDAEHIIEHHNKILGNYFVTLKSTVEITDNI